MNVFSRSPRILYSYLATEMLAPFFATFLIMNGVFFLIKLIPFLNFALEFGIGFADFIRLFSYMLPNMLLYTVPMAAMMGIIICFSRLSNDTEILALKAGGISIYQMLPPTLLVAGVISLATAYVSISLISASENAMKQLTYQLFKEKVDKGIQENQFTEALGDLVVYVAEIDRTTGEWKNVWVSDMRDQKTPAITMASSGSMVSDIGQMNVTIILRNGSLHRPDGPNAQIVNFEQYVINIPVQLSMQATKRKSRTMGELLTDAHALGLEKEAARDMLVEFHKRLVLPVGCLIMSLLGLPLGLLAGPGKKAVGIPLGLAAFVSYYIVYTAVKTMAEDGVASIALLMWTPNIIFFIATIFIIYRVAQEQPILSESLQYRYLHLYQQTLRLLCSLYTKVSSPIDHAMARGNRSKKTAHTLSRQVIADPIQNIFHQLDCKRYNRSTSTVLFDSSKEAIESGFQPCPHCLATSDMHIHNDSPHEPLGK